MSLIQLFIILITAFFFAGLIFNDNDDYGNSMHKILGMVLITLRVPGFVYRERKRKGCGRIFCPFIDR
jgi:hypothetical protein